MQTYYEANRLQLSLSHHKNMLLNFNPKFSDGILEEAKEEEEEEIDDNSSGMIIQQEGGEEEDEPKMEH